jgi:hypothetical protein
MESPKSYLVRFLRKRIQERRLRRQPNLRGFIRYPPGHFYSPLFDVESLGPNDSNLPFDGPEWWEQCDLRPAAQRSYYEGLLDDFPLLPFPGRSTAGYRYFTENDLFGLSDAFTLSGVIRKERPRRIIEVGSGFSSAVMLDTLDQTHASAELTFIEPYPDRLHSLLSPRDKSSATVLVKQVQEVPLSVFDRLEAQDLLFVDSSHVAKIGSDLAFILLRVLPRLKQGVLVHFHDIFYPFSYPIDWIHEGRAWNETLFLRAFLVGGSKFQLVAFNRYAAFSFPEVFRDRFPAFLVNPGSSIWMRKSA